MHSFFVAPIAAGTGLSSVCMGLVRSLDQIGVRVAHFKPIAQSDNLELSKTHLASEFPHSTHIQLSLHYAQQMMARNKADLLMEEILNNWQRYQSEADVVIVEGLVPEADEEYVEQLNPLLARVLGSEIILVAARRHHTLAYLNDRIEMTAGLFGGHSNPHLIGCILNKVGAPPEDFQRIKARGDSDLPSVEDDTDSQIQHSLPVFDHPGFVCLGVIKWNPEFIAPRTLDVAKHLRAEIVHEGEMRQRRVRSIVFMARTIPNMINTLKAGTLVVTPGDRVDILLATVIAVLNGVPLAGVVFTGDLLPDERVMDHCEAALKTGLPILITPHDTLSTAQWLGEMSPEVPPDDQERRDVVMESIAQYIDATTLAERSRLPHEIRLSPPAFRHSLVTRAKAANKRIVLPEGEEPRTIQAARICAEKEIARCVLLGDKSAILRLAESQGIELPRSIEILEPQAVRHRYVQPMVELRKHKGLTSDMAAAMLEDTVVLGTMMLARNEVDGLVSGAIHTTANTIRPALQLIKTKADSALVSSVFFMLLPDQALVYGDCAVNPDPNAEELADIAIQSGDTARAFGVEPRIAMISYSTGTSGSGTDVEKVRAATAIARSKRPDLIIDGPLQYDAAAIPSVAMLKAPDSPVAGKATVFVFPDLNTGNTTYKAVQRSANVVSVGPVLQGLRKPVNDLSRGATVDDIVYTIAITAIQADQT